MQIHFIDNTEKWWEKKYATVKKINETVMFLFGGEWGDNSVWQGLSFLAEEMQQKSKLKDEDEEKIYYNAIIYLLSDEMLNELLGRLKNLEKNLASTQLIESRLQLQEGQIDLRGLDMTEFNYKFLLSRVNKRNVSDVRQNMSDLVVSLAEFRVDWENIGAALLYIQPDDRYDEVADVINDWQDDKIKSDMAVVRFLAQSYFDHDGGTRDFAIDILSTTIKDEEAEKDISHIIFNILLLFIVWQDFDILKPADKAEIMERHLWLALCFGLPCVEKIKENLAMQPYLDYYLNTSGLLAEQLLENKEFVYHSKGNKDTISNLIRRFLTIAHNKSTYREIVSNFVEKEKMRNAWPEALSSYLFELIHLYIGLRDCDLIDYRLFLSDVGAKQYPYNWKKVVMVDFSDDKKQEIKKFFEMAQRPFALRTDLIVAFGSINWQEEPVFSRILELSNIYEEVYPVYGPLVYFSEEEQIWRLNATPPPKLA